MPTVYSSPIWAEPTPEHPPLGPQLPNFDRFVRAAVARYGADGSFWREHSDLPALPVTEWELWNEPNGPEYWKPAPDPAGYRTLLAAFRADLAADPDAKVISAGLFPKPKGGIDAESFLTAISADGGSDLFDVVGYHSYALTPKDAAARIQSFRARMNGLGEAAKPIWVTEIGWASAGRPSSITVDPATQAEYLRRSYALLGERRDALGIAGAIWYSLSDLPGDTWVSYSGLFTIDGQPKPAWGAMQSVAAG